MIAANIPTNLQSVYEFIDNRLVVHMARKKLKQLDATVASGIISFKYDVIQNVDNTAFYLEKSEKRGSLLLNVTEANASKAKVHPFGLALRAKPDGATELFIDSAARAMQKSLLPRAKATLGRTVVGIALFVLAFFVFAGAAVVLFPLFILAFVLTVVCYPFLHFIRKREFNREQKRMEAIVSIFEQEFGMTFKADSSDWISFWGVVKSKVPDLFTPV